MRATHTPDASKSQIRAAKVAGIDANGNYDVVGVALEAGGLRRDGLPLDKTWREAAKMSDDELLTVIAVSDEDRLDAIVGREKVEY